MPAPHGSHARFDRFLSLLFPIEINRLFLHRFDSRTKQTRYSGLEWNDARLVDVCRPTSRSEYRSVLINSCRCVAARSVVFHAISRTRRAARINRARGFPSAHARARASAVIIGRSFILHLTKRRFRNRLSLRPDFPRARGSKWHYSLNDPIAYCVAAKKKVWHCARPKHASLYD